MRNDKKNSEEEKGFVVKDRRFSAKKEEKPVPQAKQEGEPEAVPGPEAAPGEEPFTDQGPLPVIDFSQFIFSLSTSAFIQLGEIQDPFTQKAEKNLPLAKQTIDLIAMLKEKTKGNLTPEEGRIIENLLYDLRMRYVKASA
ncbi:MAG TPA: DUF1844 domain-containing protein [Thermodesulfobacteriota bacterium]|nr:DUF1844 domain-containing protein [Thermodesulfobacteriota bacterium]